MRKTILALLAATVASATLPALDLAVHAGYTSFNLGELNRANASLLGEFADGHSQPLNSGALIGTDLTQASTLPWLNFGLRAEAMQSDFAEIKTDSGYYDYSDQARLSDLLVGAKITTPAALGLKLGLALWAGYGYAELQQNDFVSYLQSGLFMGSLPVAEVETSLGYDLGSRIHLAFTGGWRWANAGYLYDDQHKPLYDNGKVWYSQGNFPINVDLSGITAQGSISYSF